jgi:phenylpropionate dioxygenase-like ring-hydroxylating dioxygenase large terminal subunit
MLTPEQNERLTRVGPGTPAGNLMRRYWLPALLSEEVPEADGAPVRVRLLGEELVAYRDTSGAVGLVSAFCPHRRAPLFFGRNEEHGLRCVYHGWKFDRGGTCVDIPSEPPDSPFRNKVRIEAYPTWEGGGCVWAYLGDPALQPPPPAYELLRAPATHRFTTKTYEDCNYLQALEGGLDSSHATIMHRKDIGDLSFLRDYERTVPGISVAPTDYGYSYSGVRKLDTNQWVRLYHYIMPMTQIRGHIATSPYKQNPLIKGHFWVPIDDTHTWTYNWFYSADPTIEVTPEFAAHSEESSGRSGVWTNADDRYRLLANRTNDYLLDRAVQKTQSFTGIPGVNTQDIAVQESMGPIVDRSLEHLGTTDRAIIVMRQLLLEAVAVVEAGGTPRGVDSAAYHDVRALDHVIPGELDWHDALREASLAKF